MCVDREAETITLNQPVEPFRDADDEWFAHLGRLENYLQRNRGASCCGFEFRWERNQYRVILSNTIAANQTIRRSLDHLGINTFNIDEILIRRVLEFEYDDDPADMLAEIKLTQESIRRTSQELVKTAVHLYANDSSKRNRR